MKHYIYITITTTKSQVSTTLNCLQPAARSRSTAFYHHCRSCLSRAGFYASPVHSTKMFQALQQHCQHSQLEVSRKLEVGKLESWIQEASGLVRSAMGLLLLVKHLQQT